MNSKQASTGNRARSAANTASPTGSRPASSTQTTAEARWRRTAVAAFYRAQARGFAPGRELEDWLEAEREVDALEAGRYEEAAAPQSAPADGDRTQPEQAAAMPARGHAASRRAKTSLRTKRGADSQVRNRGES